MNQDLSSSPYHVESQEQPGCLLKVNVKITPTEVQKLYKQAIKKVNKEISIPGFRKGKAPDATVISRYSSYVDQEWKEFIRNAAWQAGLDQSKIYPMNKESVHSFKIESYSQEEGAQVTFSYEFYPRIPSIDLTQLKISPIESEAISEAQINDVLHNIQRMHATFEDVTDRSVEEGDYVDLTINAVEESGEKPIVEDRRFEVSAKEMAPWILKLLIGKNPGETFEGDSSLAEGASEELRARFKPTHCRLTLHGIKKIILPEVDDALAAKAGASSRDNLLTLIRNNLEQNALTEQKSKQHSAFNDLLLSSYQFDLPESILKKEIEARRIERTRILEEEELSHEERSQQIQQMENHLSEESQRALRLYFLEQALIEKLGLSISQEELSGEIMKRSQSLNRMIKEKGLSSEQVVHNLSAEMLLKKTKDEAISRIEKSQN